MFDDIKTVVNYARDQSRTLAVRVVHEWGKYRVQEGVLPLTYTACIGCECHLFCLKGRGNLNARSVGGFIIIAFFRAGPSSR